MSFLVEYCEVQYLLGLIQNMSDSGAVFVINPNFYIKNTLISEVKKL